MDITIICDSCGINFERVAKEVKRSEKYGRKQYCNRSCAGKESPPAKCPPSLKEWFGKRTKDEFSPFRPHLSRVRARNHEFDITLESLKDLWEAQKGICPITGWELDHVKNGEKATPKTASLDRINNNLGYIAGNIRWISCMANFCRNSWDDEDVIDFCKAVAKVH